MNLISRYVKLVLLVMSRLVNGYLSSENAEEAPVFVAGSFTFSVEAVVHESQVVYERRSLKI